MNLWLRLFWMLATAWRRPTLALPSGRARLSFRVWPHDLDTSLHMNNGRYWTLMDLGRIDLIIRSGLLRPLLRNGKAIVERRRDEVEALAGRLARASTDALG